MKDRISPEAMAALTQLRAAGHRAVLVGGCVRDLLRGVTPHDWDITTSALPEETKAVFKHERLIEVGKRHGTLTVLLGGEPLEITTFRADGSYSDGRRPDRVRHVRSLEEDLSRRDFTINALCIDVGGQIIDLFDGRSDLAQGVIRCIGDADQRFAEDALRILRAVRFAAVLGFSIEQGTALALQRNVHRLELLSAERVLGELARLLIAPDVERVLLAHSEVMFALLPALRALDGLTLPHCLDGYRHTIHAVAAAPATLSLRLAMLLHDVGKPLCAEGAWESSGHEEAGAALADSTLRALHSPNALREQVVSLVRLHHLPLRPDRAALRALVAGHGEALLRDLIEVQRANVRAQAQPDCEASLVLLSQFETALQALLDTHPALSLGELAINGNDLLSLGFPKGEQVGRVLRLLLQEVIAERLPNEQAALALAAEQYR